LKRTERKKYNILYPYEIADDKIDGEIKKKILQQPGKEFLI
jgi:hypothetical protein